MSYEDWWWDVVKDSGLGFADEGGFGDEDEKERTGYVPGENPRYNPTRETEEEEPELVDTDAMVEDTGIAGLAGRTPNVGQPRVESRKEKDETEQRNRENYVQGGYADIELDNPRAKKEGWWDRLKQKDINPISRAKNLASKIAPKTTANVAEKMPKAVRALGTDVSLDDIDRATDQPGTKASRAIDRTKRNVGQKWQDHVDTRAKQGNRPLFGRTPAGKRADREDKRIAEGVKQRRAESDQSGLVETEMAQEETTLPPDPTSFSEQELKDRLFEWGESFRENRQVAIQDKPELLQTLREMVQNPEVPGESKKIYQEWIKTMEKVQ
jgi:hypothetical protein